MPLGLIKTDYYFMSPGPPYQWEIDYGSEDNYSFEGNLFQLTVRRDEANVYVYIWSLLNDSYDLYPSEVILPDGVTPKELSEISIQNMRTSENVAIAVELKNIGYDVSRETLRELDIFRTSILLKNSEINLISKNSEKDIINRHILDRAQIIDNVDKNDILS